MTRPCDEDFERQLRQALPDALPRLDAKTASRMRAAIISEVRGDERLGGLRIRARRAVAAFALSATMLGSVSVAAAASQPGGFAYPLKETFREVRAAIVDKPASPARTPAPATSAPVVPVPDAVPEAAPATPSAGASKPATASRREAKPKKKSSSSADKKRGSKKRGSEGKRSSSGKRMSINKDSRHRGWDVVATDSATVRAKRIVKKGAGRP